MSLASLAAGDGADIGARAGGAGFAKLNAGKHHTANNNATPARRIEFIANSLVTKCSEPNHDQTSGKSAGRFDRFLSFEASVRHPRHLERSDQKREPDGSASDSRLGSQTDGSS